jgi:uroporphyrinogen decarboxylase
VLKHTSFETFWFWEDMAYNHGPLVGPELFEKFAGKYYRKVCDWLRSKGIKHIGLDSDGDIWKLIPVWVDNGINMLWPFEVQSNMDVLDVRKQYPDLVIMGGINKKEIAKGGKEMQAEVDRVLPLIEKGGYIPELDHSIPPDIAWPVYCEYIDYMKKQLGWK